MRKIIVLLFFVFLSISTTYSYQPTLKEIELLDSLKQKNISEGNTKGLLSLKRKLNLYENALNKTSDERKIYILNSLITVINEILSEKDDEIRIKNQLIEEEKNKNLLLKRKEDYLKNSKIFFDTYGKNITTGLSLSDKCVNYFDLIDEIALKNNFPTELIIAKWSKETNCNLSNPNNGWGPFQITSQYYKPGEISVEEFSSSVQKYIDFAKKKLDYFNYGKYHNYKTRFGTENILITYDNYNIRDLKLASILYNGISSTTTLDGNLFANANLNSNLKSNSDGVITRFLKVLNWRINNNK